MKADHQPTEYYIAMDLNSLIRRGRKALSKYDLPTSDLEIAAEMYARTFKMLYEQNGYQALNPTYEESIERRIIRAVIDKHQVH